MAYAPYLLATVLSWAASMDRLSQLASEYRRTQKLSIANNKSEEEQFTIVIAEVMEYAAAELRHADLPVEKSLSLSNDVDLSVPPPEWRPRSPAQSSNKEEMEEQSP
ncbi:MAG: hypothetical protein IIA90_09420 [Chloroflexi bacterium]|nr:hypothetical protein [Chloroflexota bacterium]